MCLFLIGSSAGRSGAQLGAVEDRAQHDAHLRAGERRADAPPRAAAERYPRIAVALTFEEPLRAEAGGIWIEVW